MDPWADPRVLWIAIIFGFGATIATALVCVFVVWLVIHRHEARELAWNMETVQKVMLEVEKSSRFPALVAGQYQRIEGMLRDHEASLSDHEARISALESERRGA
jgi:hypothetical protein